MAVAPLATVLGAGRGEGSGIFADRKGTPLAC